MADEITHNATTGLTLYFCMFQQDGDVFLTGGASDEVWGTGGRDADDYDEAMTEEASCGHYKGSVAGGVGAGVYQVVVYLQAGANPADADVAVAQGEIYWDGSAEINLSIIDTVVDAILVDTGTTIPGTITTAQADLDIITGTNGVLIDDDAITSAKYDESTAYPIESADTGATQIARVGADGDTLETLSDQIGNVEADTDTIITEQRTVVNIYDDRISRRG